MFPTFDLDKFLHQLVYDENNPLLFNNGFFVYLFFIFIILYYLLRNNLTARTNLFCLTSLYFFYKASGYFVVLVIISAIADFLISNAIYKSKSLIKKKALLIFSITLNLGLLFYFKYSNFAIQILNDIFLFQVHPLNILLPVGISFYTFENISYTVDVYRGEFVPVKKFNEYLLFLSFFPKLVMGPIVRAKDFIPQITFPFHITKEDFANGFVLIVSGLFKKLIISDYITLNYVNYIFDAPERYSGLECLFAVYGYAVVIYCDFSGYSNIAIGIAQWLGFKIPPNFLYPYQSLDITDFWRRWHISLSNWLRDYLYIPLGGNRKGKFRQYLNLAATMLFGGLWHGASFNFIIWGGLHGIALSIYKLWHQATKKITNHWQKFGIYQFFSLLLTFNFVCFCWIFFKASSLTEAVTMINQICYHLNFSLWNRFWENYHSVIIMIAFGLGLHFIPARYNHRFTLGLQRIGLVGYAIIFLLLVLTYGYFKSSDQVLPIYLQF